MTNPETPATLCTRHRVKTNKTQKATQKTKKMSNMDACGYFLIPYTKHDLYGI